MSKQFSSLVDMQQWSCAEHADRRLLGTKTDGRYRWLTYQQFAEQVDHARAALSRLGVGAGDRVAVISNNRVEWAVGAYASYGLGAQYVPMYEAQRPAEWRYILEDSGAKVLLVSSADILEQLATHRDALPQLADVICFDAPAEAEHSLAHHLRLGADHPVTAIAPQPDDVAGLIYTSGTTGNPKGVVLSHGNFISNVNAVQGVFPMTEDDVSCSFLPWAHSFGQTAELHVLLSRGAAIGLAGSVETLMDDFGLVRPTLLLAVPRIFNRIYDGLQKRMARESPRVRRLFNWGMSVAARRRVLAEQGRRSRWLDLQYAFIDRVVFSKIKARFGGRLRYVFSGGAALSQQVGEFIDDIGILVFEGYGLTETSPIAATNRPDARRLGTIGKPLPGVEIFICDEHGAVLPPDTDGEIVVVGPNVMQGYHRNQAATDAVIFDLDGRRAFRTGDMGRITDDGFVKITGRFKEQYKLENGKYVVPTPVEKGLELSGLIDQVFIYGDNRPFNVCLVVPDFPALTQWAHGEGITELTVQALVGDDRAHAKIGEELAQRAAAMRGYERPRRWALLAEPFGVDNGLLTPKMSLKRPKVLERYQEQLERLYADP